MDERRRNLGVTSKCVEGEELHFLSAHKEHGSKMVTTSYTLRLRMRLHVTDSFPFNDNFGTCIATDHDDLFLTNVQFRVIRRRHSNFYYQSRFAEIVMRDYVSFLINRLCVTFVSKTRAYKKRESRNIQTVYIH